MKKMHTFYLPVIVLWGLVTGCSSKSVKTDAPVSSAQWESKLQITNKKTQKKQTLDLDLMAIKNQKARMEISATMGYPVASVLIDDDGFKAAIHPRKQFIVGSTNPDAMKVVIGVPLDPLNILDIAFDDPVKGPQWVCDLNELAKPVKCENKSSQVQVLWQERKPEHNRILISSPAFELNWFLKAPQTSVQLKSSVFSLSVPTGYKTIQVK